MSATETRWALILGASSGFGEAARSPSRRPATTSSASTSTAGRRCRTSRRSGAASRAARAAGALLQRERRRRRQAAARRSRRCASWPAARPVGMLMHSLAFGTLKPFIADDEKDALAQAQLEMTLDVMANSLVYWSQDLRRSGALTDGRADLRHDLGRRPHRLEGLRRGLGGEVRRSSRTSASSPSSSRRAASPPTRSRPASPTRRRCARSPATSRSSRAPRRATPPGA